MILTKQQTNNYNYKLTISDNNHSFDMIIGGSDFYWNLNNYDNVNKTFVITKDDKKLYKMISELFNISTINDDKFQPTIKNNIFEWESESCGIPEDANKLTIIKNKDDFSIEFWKNPQIMFNSCSICFCLSGSRNQKIAYAFMNMYLNFRDKEFGVCIKDNKEENTLQN